MEKNPEINNGSYTTENRQLDARIGRWLSVDPVERPELSPYNSMDNSPILLNDPDGNCPNCFTGVVGAGVGGVLGGVIELGSQLWREGGVTSWSAVGGSAAQGAITGGAAGLTGGLSLSTSVTVAATSNIAGGVVNRNIQGKETTATDVVVDGAIGGAFGVLGHIAGGFVENTTNSLSRKAKGELGEKITEIKYGALGYGSNGKAVVETGNLTRTGKPQVAKYDHDMTNVFTGKKLTVESKFNTSGLTQNQAAAQGNVTTAGGLIVDRTTSGQLGHVAKTALTAIGGQISATRNTSTSKSSSQSTEPDRPVGNSQLSQF